MAVVNNEFPVDVPAQNTQIVHVMEKPVKTPEQAADKFSNNGWKITVPQESKTSKTSKENELSKNLANLGGRAETVERNRKSKEIKNQNNASLANKTTTNKGIEAARQKAAAGKAAQTGKSENQGIKSIQNKTSGQSAGNSKSSSGDASKGSGASSGQSSGSSKGR